MKPHDYLLAELARAKRETQCVRIALTRTRARRRAWEMQYRTLAKEHRRLMRQNQRLQLECGKLKREACAWKWGALNNKRGTA